MSQNPCNQTWATPDDDNAWIGAFQQGVASFPIVGQFVAAFVPPSQTLNSVRCIPGNKYNETSGYTIEGYLIFTAIVLLIIYYATRK
jgi:hypothetical protein